MRGIWKTKNKKEPLPSGAHSGRHGVTVICGSGCVSVCPVARVQVCLWVTFYLKDTQTGMTDFSRVFCQENMAG